jgi:hypothetical protein
MRFSEWLETKLAEVLNPELDRLKKDEKQLIMSMEMRKDPMGRLMGFNKAGYIDAANKLKEVRARIRELEGGAVSSGDPISPTSEIRPVPAWIQSRRAV